MSEASPTYSKAILFLFAVFLLVQPLVYTESLRDIASLPRWTALALFSPLLLLSVLLYSWRYHSALYWHKLFSLAILLLAWGASTYLWSIDPVNTLQTSIKLLALILLGIAAMQFSVTVTGALTLIVSGVTGAALISIIGLLQILGFNPFDYMQYAPPAATFGNKNFAAMFLDLATPLAFILIFIARQTRDIWLTALLFGLCFSYWVLIHSRASWLALLVTMLVLLFVLYRNADFRKLFFTRGKDRLVPVILALLLPVLIFQMSSELEQLASKRQVSALDMGMEIRLRAYANSVPMIEDNLLGGSGLGSFMLAFRPYLFAVVPLISMSESMYMIHLHNDLLQTVAELGLPGLLLILAIFYVTMANAFRLVNMQTENTVRLLGLGCLLALSAFAVHAMLSFPLHLPGSAILLWLIMGVVTGLSGILKPLKRIKIHSGIVVVAGLILLTVFFINGTFYNKLLHNSAQVKALELSMKMNDCDSALAIAGQVDPTLNYDALLLTPFAYIKCEATYETAIQPINSILAYDPNNAYARIKRGYLYLESNQPDRAIQDFVVVARILPNRTSGYHGIADTAVTMGNFPLAIDMYRKVLKIEPNDRSARQMLEKLSKLPGK